MAFLEQLANRQPGMPRKPEVPGAPPTASRPADKVNPPAAASGPIGRPPQPPPASPGGAGRALPGVTPPAAPAAPAPPSTSRPAPGPSAPALGAGPGSAAGPMMGAPLQQMFDRVPSPAEMAGLEPGVEIVTPYGTMSQDGSLNLSPEGEAKYKEAKVQRRKKLGPHPFAADPNSPQIDVRLGGRMFNPFTGRWVEAD